MRKLVVIILAGVLGYSIVSIWKDKKGVDTVRAFGELTVTYLGVPLGAPIFTSNTMFPGKSEVRTIQVNNGSTVARQVAIKGVKTGPVGQATPLLESQMTLAISGDAIYGAGGTKTLQNFFDESGAADGILLGIVGPGQTKSYTVTGTLPTIVGNDMQNKSVMFDLTFGTVTASHVVINEVYYQADSAHGVDGSSSAKNKGQNHEWIELYNPTASSISLKGWTITDNSGSVTINANKKIAPGGYALVSKDASQWRFWNEGNAAEKVETGKVAGNGLDNGGDRLILKAGNGTIVDSVGWGSDTAIWNPAVLGAALGGSIQRSAPGFDTDLPGDWMSLTMPTPGN